MALRLLNNKWLGCAVTLLLFLALPDFSFSSFFIPFFIAGYLMRPLIEKIESETIIYWIIGSFVLFACLFCFWQQGYNYTTKNNQVIPYVIRTLIGISMSFFIVILLKYLDMKYYGNCSIKNLIVRIGSFTLGIYLCHELFYNGLVRQYMARVLPENNLFLYFVISVFFYLVSYGIILLISKNKYLSFALLGTKVSNESTINN